MSLLGRSYIVTGGAGGIGLATVRLLAGQGARVTMADLAPPPAEPLAEFGPAVRFRRCDVTKGADVEAVLDAATDAFGLPDGLVTSAGIDRHHDFLALDAEEFAQILDVNVLGSFRFAQACARLWARAPRAAPDSYAVVLLSSVNAVIATPTHTAYATSKGAIAQMVRVLAVELAGYGVRVNAMAPGTVHTAMLDRLMTDRPDAMQAILARTPLGRVADPSEVAAGISYLLSDAASYVTGQTLFADGGRTAQNLSL